MRIVFWINRVTRTLAICIIYCFSAATIAVRTHLNITLQAHCLSFHYYYAIYILVCIFPDNGSWRKQCAREISNWISMHDVCADVNLLKNNKINLI